MNPRETLLKAKELYDLVMELITLKDKEDIEKKTEAINQKIDEIHQNEELIEFADNVKNIIKVFNSDPLDEKNKHNAQHHLQLM